ncbi:hypothetical protein [Pseudophaeobacter arcticus]|uniref:hypothetical protein n=1 Tax=Pseudophaeobacter arcticus TaxID=385492 RepID=UPI003A979741
MNKVELSFSLTKDEAREGIIVSTRQRNRIGFLGRWLGLGKQIVLGLGLSFAAVLVSQAFDHPDPVAEMFSMMLGASAIMLIWQLKWIKATRAIAEEMANFSEAHGPTQAIFEQTGVELVSSTGRAKLPWFAIAQVMTAKNVTVLRYGAQTLIVPHRCLPSELQPLEFDHLLKEWKGRT